MKSVLHLLRLALPIFAWCLVGGVSASAGEPGVRFNFDKHENYSGTWTFYSYNPLLPKTKFKVKHCPTAEDGSVLVITADSSSGFICTAPKFDLKKFPIMRWRWRIINNLNVPEGAADPDDQSGVVYIGDGTRIKQCFVAYRWECNSPVGSWLHTGYRSGLTSVRSLCLRNRTTATGEWVIDERNVIDDFQTVYKRLPLDGFVLCVGANTQHSKSSTRIEIDYIEFLPAPPPAAK